MSKLKSYHFDLGNSNDGPIGMCARIVATSKEEALSKLRDRLDAMCAYEGVDIGIVREHFDDYAQVYISPDNITIDDIDDYEDYEDPTEKKRE